MSLLDRLGVQLPDPRRKLRQLAFPVVAPTTPKGVEPRPEERRTGADYDTEWARTFRARWTRTVLLESVLRPTAAAVARPRRRGVDRLADLRDAGGPVIFCANHHSHIDTPIVLTSLPEPWRYQVFVGAAADYFFRNRVTGAAASLLLNAIPIERATVTRRSADLAAELIDDGWSMLIFPEGGRSPDGWGQDFRGGAAYLARRTGAPVVPIHLSGTDRILPKGAKRLRPGPTTVTFGDPIHAEEGEDTRRLATRIEAAVAALADEHTSELAPSLGARRALPTPSSSGGLATTLMARATDPFEGLDEIWIWPVPHPDDPEPKDPEHLVTRIGGRTGGVLAGRAEIQTRPQRLTGTLGHRFVGTGPWRKADLGSLRIPTSDVALSPRESWLTVDGVRGKWTADGRFRLGDHDEVNRVASRGREPTAPRRAKDVGAKVVGIGRQYVRFFRGQPPERTPNLRIGDAVEGELVAADGWLVATQHRTPVADGCTEAWHVRVDHDLGVGPLGLGIGLAALGLVHHSLLAYQGEWREI